MADDVIRMTDSQRRRARKARLLEHIANGTYVPRPRKSQFHRSDIATAMAQDIARGASGKRR